MYRVYSRLMCANLNTKFLNSLPSNTKVTVLLRIEDDKPQVFTQKLLKQHAITIPEAVELEEAQPTSIDKSRQKIDIKQIIEEHFGRVLLRFGHFVNLQIPLELPPLRNNFSISTQKEVSLQKNHKKASSGRPDQNQLSMILRLLLQEYDMVATFLKIQILQLIGFSLTKIITLPVILPNA